MEQTRSKNEYRTGDTRPPKNYRGIIAFLLVTVILLCGISSALGLMNIKLWQQLQEQEDTSVHFSQPPQIASAKGPNHYGFTGRSVSAFWQAYSKLPEGVYITQVEPASAAYAAGLREGDVVLCVDQNTVRDMPSLEQYLQSKTGTVAVQLSRSGHLIVLNLTLPEE